MSADGVLDFHGVSSRTKLCLARLDESPIVLSRLQFDRLVRIYVEQESRFEGSKSLSIFEITNPMQILPITAARQPPIAEDLEGRRRLESG